MNHRWNFILKSYEFKIKYFSYNSCIQFEQDNTYEENNISFDFNSKRNDSSY